jgi:hypothetical protein
VSTTRRQMHTRSPAGHFSTRLPRRPLFPVSTASFSNLKHPANRVARVRVPDRPSSCIGSQFVGQVSPPTGGAFSSSTRNTHAPIQTNFSHILYRRKLCARRGGTTYPAFVRRATWCCFGSSRSFESRSSMAHGSPGRHASRQWDGGGGELVEEGGERFISFISFISVIAFIAFISFISVISFIHNLH